MASSVVSPTDVRGDLSLLTDFVAQVARDTDVQPIDDARWSRLVRDRAGHVLVANADGRVAGFVLLTPGDAGPTGPTMDLAIDPRAAPGTDVELVHAGLDSAADRPAELWTQNPSDALDAALADEGLFAARTLLEMRIPLPIAVNRPVPTRPFRPGDDDAAWLAVNNAAFAWHPEQGGWTQADLDERMAGPWFRPEDFRVHDPDGELVGFCWTKRHPTRGLGEIYVIAVRPDLTGRGLGRAMTEAGLAHLGRDLATGMLYVEEDNEAAVGLYRDMGFETHHRVRCYRPRPA